MPKKLKFSRLEKLQARMSKLFDDAEAAEDLAIAGKQDFGESERLWSRFERLEKLEAELLNERDLLERHYKRVG